MTAEIIGELLLAAVLGTAGVAKLFDLDGSRRTVTAFGVAPGLAQPLGTLLPVAEIAAAALLVAGMWSPTAALVGGLSALGLLGAFSAAIAVNLARGRAPDCHCFGALHSAPAGPQTLARNGALLALAAWVTADGQPFAAAVAAAALILVAAVLWRVRGRGPSHTEGLTSGTPAPGFEVRDPAGRVHSLGSLLTADRPVLLVFSNPGCGPCTALAPALARWQREHASMLTIAVIESDRDDVPAEDPYGRRVFLQHETEVADLYDARGTPTAVLIGPDGAIGGPVAAGAGQIERLVARVVPGFAPQAAGAPAPPAIVVIPLIRRELLMRSAGAWAAISALTWPLRSVAARVGIRRRAAEPCEDAFDCPDPGHMRCREGRCRCDEGMTRCDPDEATTRRCFDLERSRDHCGSCNHPCAGDYPECCEGRCGEFGFTRCNCAGETCPGEHDVCSASPDDPTNPICFPCAMFGWRRCGNECGDPATHRCCGEKLYAKSALGPGDWRCCGPERDRRLVNVRESENNCGGCGRRCAEGKFCFEGRCRSSCPTGRRRCGNTCGDPRTHRCCKGKLVAKSDPDHCGGCGVQCGDYDCCSDGCCSYNASACCPDGCKNLALDDDNCGACGTVCGPNEFCRFGVCTCPLGQDC